MIVDRLGFILRGGILLSTMVDSLSVPAETPSSTCAVVGVGVLGTSLCRMILQDPSLAHLQVTGITKTSNRHDLILQEVFGDNGDADNTDTHKDRFQLTTADDMSQTNSDDGGNSGAKFDHVTFCAPPSGFEDYPQAVKDATDLWTGPQGGGVFLFTSSGAVYSQDSGVITEKSPVASAESANPRMLRLINAEKACLTVGGTCLRLAGLYNLQRGAHNFWITSGKEVSGSPDGLINQVHYDDAAGACLAALKAGIETCQGKAFLVSDGHPMTRQQICESALKAAVYRDAAMPEFSTPATGSPVGKIYDCSSTHNVLDWKLQFKSFDEFMMRHS